MENYETLRVLLVDDDSICLLIVGAMLRKLKFQVVTAQNPQDALGTLRARGSFAFDLVISDVHMPDINGFELQHMIAHEFQNLPVALMSIDNQEGIVRQGMQNGAISFIEKPVSENALTCLWQFLIAQKKGDIRCSAMGLHVERPPSPPAATAATADFAAYRNPVEETTITTNLFCETKTGKKKLVWTDLLHFKFLDAITSLGIHNAVPKNILKLMNVPGLTRENVASHLQKYRQFLRRLPSNNYQPRFGPKRVNKFAKLDQLFTRTKTESVAQSPSPYSDGSDDIPGVYLSGHEDSLFYRGWKGGYTITESPNSYHLAPKTTFDSGSGLSFAGDSDYSSCLRNMTESGRYVAFDFFSQTERVNYDDGDRSSYVYSVQQFSASQFSNAVTLNPINPSTTMFQNMAMFARDSISGANPSYHYLCNDQQTGYEHATMNCNNCDTVGFGQSYDDPPSQPFL